MECQAFLLVPFVFSVLAASVDRITLTHSDMSCLVKRHLINVQSSGFPTRMFVVVVFFLTSHQQLRSYGDGVTA